MSDIDWMFINVTSPHWHLSEQVVFMYRILQYITGSGRGREYKKMCSM